MNDGLPPAAPQPGPEPAAAAESKGLRLRLARALLAFDPVQHQRQLEQVAAELASLRAQVTATEQHLSRSLQALQGELERLRDGSTPELERRLDHGEASARTLQAELERLRDLGLPRLEHGLDELALQVDETVGGLQQLRDDRLPALSERTDVLVDRLAVGLEEVASLVERALRREPLPAPAPSVGETGLAAALAEVQPVLLEAFRGSGEEIRHRLEEHLGVLGPEAPVLDLGCGRGELLDLLREGGVAAAGVESDPALATAARRRGLEVLEGDVLEVLGGQPDDAWGAATAIHLFEHLAPDHLLALLHQLRRVLRPGGLLLIECPNPHSLRVGAALFWLDPTHRRPLLPETLSLLLRATGFEVATPRFVHPFPAEQRFARGGGGPELEELARRLDDLLNAPRDFVLAARRPATTR